MLLHAQFTLFEIIRIVKKKKKIKRLINNFLFSNKCLKIINTFREKEKFFFYERVQTNEDQDSL